MPSKKSHLLI
uniref:Uncharacterized protein n=1 Tax=Vitis vinifera TaxID=29760 RepID=F6HAT6_VITVI